MNFTVKTAIRTIVTSDRPLQPFEGTHLTRERFKLENGLWIRRFYPEPKEYDLVFEVSGSINENALAEYVITQIEQGKAPEPGQGE